jgi:hypothetical protein
MTDNVTGRDGLIVMKALAYAIVAIERLPDKWQEWSDKEGMRKLLDAMTSDQDERDWYLLGARLHLEHRGLAFEGGRAVLAPLDSGTVVPLK